MLFFSSLVCFGLHAGAGHAISAAIADITFEVHIIAGAGLDFGDSLVLFTVETLRVRLSAHERLVHAEEAFGLAKSTIMGRP